MTLAQINKEIEKHFSYWTDNYNRKVLNSNDARITGEYICKACIMYNKGEAEGMKIIQNRSMNIPSASKKKTTSNEETLKFIDLIQCLWDLDFFKNNPITKNQFDILRNITNPSSHSVNSVKKIVTEQELETCHNNIKPLIEWYYNVTNQPISKEIQNALDGKPDLEYLSESHEKWREFFIACHDFNRRYQYILVSPESISENPDTIAAFTELPWRLVLDFNPKSDLNEMGLLYHFNKLKGSGYQKNHLL
ncbi:hypothetical protein ACFFJX_19150 [Pseudarcicella hirudinis]|uniref:hypothetical protein n=1 Tax=Pseudarcicella hirudinis TaxID=1079859 RepID=UPI0035E9DCD9